MNAKQPLDPALRLYLDEQAANAAGPIQSPAQARRLMDGLLETRAGIPGLPNGVISEDLWVAGPAGDLRVRRFVPPAAAAPFPVLVFLHGGGWVVGSIETHDPFCRLLAEQAGVGIVSVDYRLAPESPYPAALDDAEAAFRWTVGNAAEWGADPARLALGGDSSGANLAAVLANRLAAEGSGPSLRALVLLYPVTDHPSARHPSYAENATGYGLMAEAMEWYWAQYAADVPAGDPSVSPLRGGPTLPPLPPTLVATAEYDVLRDEGIAYARKLADAGVPVQHLHAPDMPHDFPVGPGTVARFPQCAQALAQIAEWLRATLLPARG